MENKTLTLAKLQQLITKEFAPPFVEGGLVKASLSPNGQRLYITIGPRDIEIDEAGTVVGCGTSLI